MRSLFTSVIKLYPSVESFSRDGDTYKAYDKDGKEVTIDKSAIDTEHNKTDYQDLRVGIGTSSGNYNTITNQLDQLYHDMKDGKFGADAKTGEWYVGITSVKTAFPKPS
tara:strand:- start:37 stop:363 length:327 start_codon:yes stop_codon:yes gene_type:complete